MPRDVRSYVIIMVGLVLAGCGGGGGGSGSTTAPSENQVDVAVAGLPAGVAAAITITDLTGKTVSSLTTAGQIFVAGPGTFNVSADPVVAATATYVATVVPAPRQRVRSAQYHDGDGDLRARPAPETQVRGCRVRVRFAHFPGVAAGRNGHLCRRAARTDPEAGEWRAAGAGARHFGSCELPAASAACCRWRSIPNSPPTATYSSISRMPMATLPSNDSPFPCRAGPAPLEPSRPRSGFSPSPIGFRKSQRRAIAVRPRWHALRRNG